MTTPPVQSKSNFQFQVKPVALSHKYPMKLNTLFEGFSKQIHNHQNDSSDEDSKLSANQTDDAISHSINEYGYYVIAKYNKYNELNNLPPLVKEGDGEQDDNPFYQVKLKSSKVLEKDHDNIIDYLIKFSYKKNELIGLSLYLGYGYRAEGYSSFITNCGLIAMLQMGYSNSIFISTKYKQRMGLIKLLNPFFNGNMDDFGNVEIQICKTVVDIFCKSVLKNMVETERLEDIMNHF